MAENRANEAREAAFKNWKAVNAGGLTTVLEETAFKDGYSAARAGTVSVESVRGCVEVLKAKANVSYIDEQKNADDYWPITNAYEDAARLVAALVEGK